MMNRILARLAALPVLCAPAMAFAETTAAAVDAEGGHHGEAANKGLPQFDPSTFTSQIFWLLVTFFILYTVFAKKTLPAISGTIEKRRAHIARDTDMAANLREESESIQKAYEELLGKARAEAMQLMTTAASEVRASADAKLAALREKTTQETERLEKRLADESRKAMDDMTAIAAEIASEAAVRIVGIKPDIAQAQNVVQSLNKRKAA